MNQHAETGGDCAIAPAEVARLLKDHPGEFLLIDCRTRDEWEAAHVDGARSAPLSDLGLHMSMLREHEERLIVVMCHSGKRSHTLATVLRAERFSNVKYLSGGILRWISEIDPAMKLA